VASPTHQATQFPLMQMPLAKNPDHASPAPGSARPAMTGRTWPLNVISPLVLFPVVWLFGVAVAQVHILTVQRPWSLTMWVVVFVVPLAFVCGALLASSVVVGGVHATAAPPTENGRRRVQVILTFFLVLGYAEECHQWLVAGGIPLLSSNIDATRFAQPGGPTILLTDLLSVTAIVALVMPKRLFTPSARIELTMAFLALAAFALAGGRGTVILPLVVAVFGRILYHRRLPMRAVIIGGLILLSLGSSLFFFRTSQHRTASFETELYQRVLPATPLLARPAIPLALAIATNYEALARIVDYFPAEAPFGNGLYDAAGFHQFLPSRSLGPLSSQLSPPWVTSTVASPLWADGGLPAVVLGLALIGLLSNGVYLLALRTGALRHALVAGYLIYLTFFGFYSNLWTQQVDWLVIVPLLYLCAVVAERDGLISGVLGARGYAQFIAVVRSVKIPSTTDACARRGRRGRIAAVAAALVALVVATSIFRAVARPATPTSLPAFLLWPEEVTVPTTANLDSASLLGDGASLERGPLRFWIVEGSTRLARISQFTRKGRVFERTRLWNVALGKRQPQSLYHYVSWRGVSALFVTRPVTGGISVRGVALDHPTRVLVSGLAPIPVTRGARYVEWFGRWTAAQPALFVVQIRPSGRLRLFVASSGSGYRKVIFTSKLPLVLKPVSDWEILGSPGGPSEPTNLAFVLRDAAAAGSHRPEVHVLLGSSGYQSFGTQVALGLEAPLQDGYVFTAGWDDKHPVIVGLNRAAPEPQPASVFEIG
jgi:oligosaccharide repeat unit polymerase